MVTSIEHLFCLLDSYHWAGYNTLVDTSGCSAMFYVCQFKANFIEQLTISYNIFLLKESRKGRVAFSVTDDLVSDQIAGQWIE